MACLHDEMQCIEIKINILPLRCISDIPRDGRWISSETESRSPYHQPCQSGPLRDSSPVSPETDQSGLLSQRQPARVPSRGVSDWSRAAGGGCPADSRDERRVRPAPITLIGAAATPLCRPVRQADRHVWPNRTVHKQSDSARPAAGQAGRERAGRGRAGGPAGRAGWRPYFIAARHAGTAFCSVRRRAPRRLTSGRPPRPGNPAGPWDRPARRTTTGYALRTPWIGPEYALAVPE